MESMGGGSLYPTASPCFLFSCVTPSALTSNLRHLCLPSADDLTSYLTEKIEKMTSSLQRSTNPVTLYSLSSVSTGPCIHWPLPSLLEPRTRLPCS